MLLETSRVPVESQRIDRTYKLFTLYQKNSSKYVDSYFRALKTVRLMTRVSEVYTPLPKSNMVDQRQGCSFTRPINCDSEERLCIFKSAHRTKDAIPNKYYL
jgi:hypothetical protein